MIYLSLSCVTLKFDESISKLLKLPTLMLFQDNLHTNNSNRSNTYAIKLKQDNSEHTVLLERRRHLQLRQQN